MSQINVNPGDRDERDSDTSGAMAAATKNLTWAIAAVIVIVAVVFAILYLVHNLHP
jgi:hypothetical protein